MTEWTNRSRNLSRVALQTGGMTQRQSKKQTHLSGGEDIIRISSSTCVLLYNNFSFRSRDCLLTSWDSFRAVRVTLLFSSQGPSTRAGAMARRDPVHLLCLTYPLTWLVLLYYLHHLSGVHLLSCPHHLICVHGLVLERVVTPYLLPTPPSCHATRSGNSLNTNSAKKTGHKHSNSP